MKSKFLRKLLAVSLCTTLVGSTAVTIPVFVPESSIVAQAGSTFGCRQYGKFWYSIENNEATIEEYSGNEDAVIIPSEIDGYSVTGIGRYAFSDCGNLFRITIPSSVTRIGDGAFQYCKRLSRLSLSDGLISIGDGAFEGCKNLNSLVLPDSVSEIGYEAFNNTAWYNSSPDGLVYAGKVAYQYKGTMPDETDIVLLSGTKGIASGAFGWIDGLKSIYIPSSVIYVGDSAFESCVNLDKIIIPDSLTNIGRAAFDDTSWYFNQPNGVVYIGNVAYGYRGSIASREYICLKGGTKSIAPCCFDGCEEIGSITIPGSVTNIGESAFSGCTGLESISISEGVTSIGHDAFYNCSGLTSITIPESLTSIGEFAFSGCTGLTSITIPEGVTSIGRYAFQCCTGLTSITIPNSVTFLGEDLFYRCQNLTDIYGKEGSAAEKYVENTSFNFIPTTGDTNLKNNSCVDESTLIEGTDVTLTGDADGGKPSYEYSYCYKKVSDSNWTVISDYTTVTSKSFKPTSAGTYEVRINVKDSTGKVVQKTIKLNVKSAFGNEFLDDGTIEITEYRGIGKNVTIPSDINGVSVTSIGSSAFSNCSSLTSINIPDTVTSIGSSAFSNCSSLMSINIPDSVTSIGSSAFSNCSSLTSINMPNSVTKIGQEAFYNCRSLTSINIPDSVTKIGQEAFYNCSSLTSITIPNSVTSIEQNAFKKCASLTKVNIPDSLTSIEYGVFESCSSLTSISIPDSVTSIGQMAFVNCSSLTNINIPSSVTYIGYLAFGNCGITSVTIPSSVTIIASSFSDCTALKNINVDSGNTNYCSIDGVLYDKDVSKLIFCPAMKDNITIPQSVKGIGDSAFVGNSALKSITIPSSVSSIDSCAFSSCENLESVSLSSALTEISYGCFIGCESLKSIVIPAGVTKIDNHAFKGCTGLSSVSIPSSVTSIGHYAFFECSSLTSITIPNSVTSIGYSAFYKCSSLTSVTIPSGVSNIESCAFMDCTALSRAYISEGVTKIDRNAYNGCTNLKEITIPKTVTEIGEMALGYYFDYGNYRYQKVDGLTIYGQKNTEAETYANNNGFKFVSTYVDTELKNTSAISAATVTAGTELTMNGKSTGGTSPYTYAYYYKKSTDSTWTKIAGYSTATSKSFKPTSAGTYTARVNVRDSAGTLVQKDFTVTVKADATPLKNNSTVGATSVTAGTAVTLTGKATGGTSPYKYAYYYKKSTDSAWTKAYVTSSGSAYTKYDSVTFKPITAGTYNVKINVKDDNGTGTVVSKEFTVTVKAEAAALTNNSTISATTVTANTEVTMNGKATGGTSPYKFAYYYKKSTDSSWTKVYVTASGSAYTKNTSVSFKPTTAGTYNVRINAKDDSGTVVQKEFSLKVTAALKNSSTISSTSVSKNTAVTLMGKATGGTSPYKYAYYYKKSTDSSWTKAYVTSSGSAYTKYDSVTFKPTASGTYTVRINVKDKYGEGQVVSKEFTLMVK